MTTQLSIKTDPRIKQAASKRAEYEGMTLTAIVNVFLREYAHGKFQLSFMNIENQQLSKESIMEFDEIFKSKKIVSKANQISQYLNNHKL